MDNKSINHQISQRMGERIDRQEARNNQMNERIYKPVAGFLDKRYKKKGYIADQSLLLLLFLGWGCLFVCMRLIFFIFL